MTETDNRFRIRNPFKRGAPERVQAVPPIPDATPPRVEIPVPEAHTAANLPRTTTETAATPEVIDPATLIPKLKELVWSGRNADMTRTLFEINKYLLSTPQLERGLRELEAVREQWERETENGEHPENAKYGALSFQKAADEFTTPDDYVNKTIYLLGTSGLGRINVTKFEGEETRVSFLEGPFDMKDKYTELASLPNPAEAPDKS